MKQLIPILTLLTTVFNSFAQQPATPDKVYGQLFIDVQLGNVFSDGKTFVDCTPKRKITDILYDYGLAKSPQLDLKKFVSDNFNIPLNTITTNTIKDANTATHIQTLWKDLKRAADNSVNGSSLLPLPNAYIVPGGRFREIYYWDSYFTMLGLKESGETVMVENMIKNFAFLIDQYGHIPNGNRSYYLSRSQPPFFSLMVELLASIKGDKVYNTYLPQLEKEYNYWMDKTASTKHVVKMPNGSILNRYYDRDAIPRQESYKEDAELSEAKVQELAMRIRVASPEALKKILDDERAKVCRDLRSGAESGWDFSSRWFADEQQINTIQTTQYIPVDLNCLLYQLENCIAKAKALAKQKTGSNTFKQLAAKRKAAILKYCWNASSACFYDYNLVTQTQSTSLTAAAFFPLFVKIASAAQAKGVIAIAQRNLFKPGGVVTTTKTTGQQWDAPNGWAPLQWITVKGLLNYKFNIIANDMASRWIKLNDKVYQSTGKMMEKYNVEDLNKEAGGGEYPSQDGFGWTNGVYLAFKALLSKK